MELEGQLDQTVDELRVRKAGSLPEFGVHADRGETGNGVEFVDVDFSVLAIEEKVATSHSGAVDGEEGAHGIVLKRSDLFFAERGGDHELGALFEIFGGVIVILAVRNDFSWNRGANLFIAEDRNLDFAAVDAAFDNDLEAEFGGQVDGFLQLVDGVDARHAH